MEQHKKICILGHGGHGKDTGQFHESNLWYKKCGKPY